MYDTHYVKRTHLNYTKKLLYQPTIRNTHILFVRTEPTTEEKAELPALP